METSPTDSLIDRLRRTVLPPDGAGVDDGELLGHFIERHDEAAFAALVGRHGPMVWGVCRRLLHQHDAEDAFQATFLVLARKAASIRSKEVVGNWLYGVAHQTALQARRANARRGAREVQVTQMPDTEAVEPDLWVGLRPVLDEELSRLPHIYRTVIVLCDLEGRTRKEVAGHLGVPEGTVAARVARARALLAKRLTRRGVTLSGGALAAALAQQGASAGVPKAVVVSVIRAARAFAAGTAVPEAIRAHVAALAEGVMKTMMVSQFKVVVAVLFAVVCIGCTAAFLPPVAGPPPTAAGQSPTVAEPPPTVEKKDENVQGTAGQQGETDKDRLQGKWQITSLTVEGKVIRRGDKLAEWKDVFLNDVLIEGERLGQVKPDKGKFKLDDTRNPKQITIQDADGKLTFRGIYAIEGDTLKVCINGDGTDVRRPEEFVAKKGTPVVIVEFKKASAKK